MVIKTLKMAINGKNWLEKGQEGHKGTKTDLKNQKFYEVLKTFMSLFVPFLGNCEKGRKYFWIFCSSIHFNVQFMLCTINSPVIQSFLLCDNPVVV